MFQLGPVKVAAGFITSINDGSPSERRSVLIDDRDRQIISELRQNARFSSREIAESLRHKGTTLTSRAIRKRIQRMEKQGTIEFSVVVRPSEGPLYRRVLLIKLKTSNKFSERLSQFANYLKRSHSCTFAARLSGDIDLIACVVFPQDSDGKLECDRIRDTFSEIIQELRSYEVDGFKAV